MTIADAKRYMREATQPYGSPEWQRRFLRSCSNSGWRIVGYAGSCVVVENGAIQARVIGGSAESPTLSSVHNSPGVVVWLLDEPIGRPEDARSLGPEFERIRAEGDLRPGDRVELRTGRR